MLRATIIAGNWKMHFGPTEADEFFRAFLPICPDASSRSILFFPPAVALASSARAIDGRDDIRLGVQNIHWEAKGAFTGETSASMATDAGASLVLVGHSERRHVFGESDAETRLKVASGLAAGLTPILCVGELLEHREAGNAASVVESQLRAVFDDLPEADAARVLIAYEPVWAIGTGRTASPADAREMHAEVRGFLERRYGSTQASSARILYGGSVKPDNVTELLAEDGVDGVLVGGASLDPAGFAKICAAAA